MMYTHAKNILVTGGAGFIGSHVAEKLLARGDRVIIVDNFNDAYNPKLKKHNIAQLKKNDAYNQLRVYTIDIRDQQSLEQVFIDNNVDIICHLAARAGVRPSIEMPAEYITSNILGTTHIFECAQKYNIDHVVFASSSSVYGNCTETPFSENYNISAPISQYAMTKGAGELLAYTYHHLYDMSITCLRFFTVYGPRGRVDMAPFIFLHAIHNGDMLHLFGDGSAVRDFTYVDDIADGVVKALSTQLGFAVLNLGRGEPIILKDFIETIEKITGKKANISYEGERAGDVAITHADISKAQKLIGYQPQTSVHDGMEKMYAWYVHHYLPLMVNNE